MPELARKRATYDDLWRVPENMTGEIIDGELTATPRPSRKHGYALSSLGSELGYPYHFGRGGGPGGWIILAEPEIAFGSDILVPDLAGWRRERFPESEDHNWISVAPDWVCEVLSPNTLRRDKVQKMPLYAAHGVPYCWIVDPANRTLETFKLEGGRWTVLGVYAEDDPVRAEPFQAIEFGLGSLWLGHPSSSGQPA